MHTAQPRSDDHPCRWAAGVLGSEAVHLLALCEVPDVGDAHSQRVGLPSQSDRARFGIAFLDAAAGRFYIGSASDDAGRANLGAILMQVAHIGKAIESELLATPLGAWSARVEHGCMVHLYRVCQWHHVVRRG